MLRMSLLMGVFWLPAAAIAQPISGLYIGAAVGANFAGAMLSTENSTKIYSSAGPLSLVDIGWEFGNGLRVEIEGSYRSNGVSKIATLRRNGQFYPLSDVDGNVATYATMANLLYDIDWTPFDLPLHPYVGAGVGYGWLDLGHVSGDGFASLRPPAATPTPARST